MGDKGCFLSQSGGGRGHGTTSGQAMAALSGFPGTDNYEEGAVEKWKA
jgi:hypothetical protein